jgi:pimeloyl-ACP methyl ester carboxylesterase
MIYEPRRAPRHEILRLRGLDHHLTRWGPPDAAPYVFLHGWADTSDTFQFVVDAFAHEHAIAAPDWRGFGRSQWQHASYWFPDYFADLDALLDVVSPHAPATLVGHSMGGNIAALYAGIRPERVARLVNLEGFGLPRRPPEDAPAQYRKWLEQLQAPPAWGRFDSVESFARVLLKKNPRLTPARAAFVARSWSIELPDGGCSVNADPWHKVANPVLYRRDEAEACWRRCVAPVLLVLGGLSEFRRGLGADGTPERFASVYPNLAIATLAEAGHMLHHERPEELAALIEPFMTGAAAEAAT